MNKISLKWKRVAYFWTGNKKGKHCHWCKFAKIEDCEVYCGNKKSKFCDGKRIRTWDGESCAKKCGYFEIAKWYTSDRNFNKTFKEEK